MINMRYRPRTTTRSSWEECSMKEAMEAVSSGKLSYRKAADIFNVPKDALHRRVNKKLKFSPSKQHKNILGKFRCVLSTKQEEELKT